MTGSIVVDTPEGIETYRRLAILHGLKIEISAQEHGFTPAAAPTRGLAFGAARNLLISQGIKPPRTRKACLAALKAYLEKSAT